MGETSAEPQLAPFLVPGTNDPQPEEIARKLSRELSESLVALPFLPSDLPTVDMVYETVYGRDKLVQFVHDEM